MKQKLTGLKWEIDSSTIIIGNFYVSSSVMDRIRQKINKETEHLSNITNQIGLADICRTLHSRIHIFSSLHGTISSLDYMLGHKHVSVSLKGFKSYKVSFLTMTEWN